MDAGQIEAMLRSKADLTDESRADLFDMHAGNVASITHPVLRAMALMAVMDPAELKLAEGHPNVLRAIVAHSGRAK